jgi:hypothetical protein
MSIDMLICGISRGQKSGLQRNFKFGVTPFSNNPPLDELEGLSSTESSSAIDVTTFETCIYVFTGDMFLRLQRKSVLQEFPVVIIGP